MLGKGLAWQFLVCATQVGHADFLSLCPGLQNEGG